MLSFLSLSLSPGVVGGCSSFLSFFFFFFFFFFFLRVVCVTCGATKKFCNFFAIFEMRNEFTRIAPAETSPVTYRSLSVPTSSSSSRREREKELYHISYPHI